MIILTISIWFSTNAHAAADRFTLSGTIRSSETGETIIGAVVIVPELPGIGASSNAYGFYSLTVPEGRHIFRIEYLGYTPLTDTLTIDRNLTLNFTLVPQPIREKEVTVTAERSNQNVASTEMGVRRLAVQDVVNVPVLLGEKDVLKTIQLLPGIESAGEGNTGYYARGGNIDQNLIILDEAPVYNSAHLLGFLSVFNSDAIKDVDVMTGDMPAEYGGRLSSVLDIRTRDGNTKDFDGQGGVGILDSRLTLDGPIVKDEGSFIVSGRRTYADLFLRLSSDTTLNRTRLYFFDLNAKANYTVGPKDHVYLSGYFGRDNFNYPDVIGFNWGNTTATLRWNHIFGEKFFSNLSLIYSDYEYTNIIGASSAQYTITSGIQDLNAKIDFQYFIESGNMMKFGVEAIKHTFIPGTVSASAGSSANNIIIPHRIAYENAAYFSHEFSPLQLLKIEYGVRFSAFSLVGPAAVYTYDSVGDIASSKDYGPGSIIKTYAGIEPRLAATYILDESNSLKASYTRTAQYVHLLSNSTTSNPRDLWVPSSNNVPAQYADQASVGYFRNFMNNGVETSLELYYKNMQHLIDYRNGADLQLNPTVESLLLYGRGWSYGAEFLVKKTYGDVTGWIGYTLSRTEEQIPGVNGGSPFPARQDRTHDISIVFMYRANERWNYGATWVYNTGNAVTFPSGNYLIDGRLVPYYTARNAYRMPAYHRLDLSVTYSFNPHSNLNFSLYNAYDRANAYAIYFRRNKDNPNVTEAVQLTLFPIIPSLTYNFNF